METRQIANQQVTFHRYNTVIVGAGAAGMNCAVHLYEFMKRKGIEAPQDRIAIVTRGLALGASRMSGSDKQTYYKLGTSPNVPDCAKAFADTLTAAGCCHADLALAEGINSLREFYHLVQAGVAFPTDSMGTFIGYKTDHDPAERATSAGPKTSKFMSECLQRQAEQYGIPIFDNQEVAHLLTTGAGKSKRIAGIVTWIADCGLRIRIAARHRIRQSAIRNPQLNVFLAANVVLAAGGPGELYKTSVYPRGQVGMHGLAFQAGLAAENLTESQFGLASMQVPLERLRHVHAGRPAHLQHGRRRQERARLPRRFLPVDEDDGDEHLPQGLPVALRSAEDRGSEIVADRRSRVQREPEGPAGLPGLPPESHRHPAMQPFNLDELEPEAFEYLRDAGALQKTPIERLAHMNPPAVEIYPEHGIDLYQEPLEIAVCAQHNNGGFAVNKWWESSIPHTFVIGEMAGTHGVKRPGGSALNAGQVGGLRAAEYIVNVYGSDLAHLPKKSDEIEQQIQGLVDKLNRWSTSSGRTPQETIEEIQSRMTASAAHMREENDASESLRKAIELWKDIQDHGLTATDSESIRRCAAGRASGLGECRLSQGHRGSARARRRLARLLPGPEPARHTDPSRCPRQGDRRAAGLHAGEPGPAGQNPTDRVRRALTRLVPLHHDCAENSPGREETLRARLARVSGGRHL